MPTPRPSPAPLSPPAASSGGVQRHLRAAAHAAGMTTTLESPTFNPPTESPDNDPQRHWRLRSKVLIGVGALAAVAGGLVVIEQAMKTTDHETRVFQQT